MKYCKLIISFALIFAMVLSFSIPVYASSDTSTTFWQFIENGLDGSLFNDFCHNLSDSWDTLTGAEKDTAYQNYVNGLPFSGFGRDGTTSYFFLPAVCDVINMSPTKTDVTEPKYLHSSSVGTNFSAEWLNSGYYLYCWFQDMTAPCDGTYTIVNNITCTNCHIANVYNIASGSLASGSRLTWPSPSYTSAISFINSNSYTCSISGSYGWRVVPAASSSIISNNYPASSRPAGIVNNCTITNTITNSDNTTTTNSYNLTVPIIDDLVGVDNNFVFTDPLTGVGITLDNWWYDYVTRRYNFSYTDNSTTVNGSVTYGDENITIVNGDTTTIYNYPAPAADPDPTPTDSVGWLEKIYNKVCEVLQAVLGIDTSPNVTVNTTGTDITVTVPGADGTDAHDWKFSDMKAKFGWIHEIHTIIISFVSDVTGDSETAYAMAASPALLSDDGSTSAQVVSSSGSSSAAPSIAIDFGQAQSVYGYNYGGSMQVLDLSWYTQYKPTVDAILSGFLWILFLWGIFKHAPSIISGGDVVENQMDDISKGSRGHKS